eukprot:427136_1
MHRRNVLTIFCVLLVIAELSRYLIFTGHMYGTVALIENNTPITKRQCARRFNFEYGEWLDSKEHDINVVRNVQGMTFFQPKGTCDAKHGEDRHFVGQFKGNQYLFDNGSDNDTMCNFLFSIVSKNIQSIAIIGDSVSIPTFNGFIRDVFQYKEYECVVNKSLKLSFQNLRIVKYTKRFYEILNEGKFDQYIEMKENEFCEWNDKCVSPLNDTVTKRECQCVPRLDVNMSLQIKYLPDHGKTRSFSFVWCHIHSYSIFPDLVRYKTNNAIRTERYSMGYKLFEDVINEFDSTITNIGLHYNSMPEYFQTVRYIFDVLEADNGRNKKHIFRHTFPQHFKDKIDSTSVQFGDFQFSPSNWRNRRCLKFNDSSQKHITQILSEELEQFYANVYTIDYYNVLKNRGDAHPYDADCTHWCASHRLWKPFWFLLTQIYTQTFECENSAN